MYYSFLDSRGSYWLWSPWYSRFVSTHHGLATFPWLRLASALVASSRNKQLSRAVVVILQVYTFSPKRSSEFQLLFVRFIQGVTSLGLIAAICLLVIFTSLTVADLFASMLAFIATGWGILSVSGIFISTIGRVRMSVDASLDLLRDPYFPLNLNSWRWHGRSWWGVSGYGTQWGSLRGCTMLGWVHWSLFLSQSSHGSHSFPPSSPVFSLTKRLVVVWRSPSSLLETKPMSMPEGSPFCLVPYTAMFPSCLWSCLLYCGCADTWNRMESQCNIKWLDEEERAWCASVVLTSVNYQENLCA